MNSLETVLERPPTLACEDHLGLVRLCAGRFKGKGIEYDDLYSAGCLGLVKASRAFEPERGLKFSTYAVPVILGEIKRLFRDSGAIKVSRSVKELSLKTSYARDKFIADKGREPRISELSEIMGVPEPDVVEALNVSLPPLSLTASDDEDGTGETDISVEGHDTAVIDLLALRQVMATLDENDKRLLYLRYFSRRTQSETAASLGMTQVQVSRREKKLLSLMRMQLE